MSANQRRSPVLLWVLGFVCAGLGLAAVAVQAWRWADGESSYKASSVAILTGIMFVTFGVALIVAAARSSR